MARCTRTKPKSPAFGRVAGLPVVGGAVGVAVLLAVVLVAAIAAPAVRADEFPKRKPGLWEMKTSGGPVGARVMQQCIDAQTDDLLRTESNQGQTCTRPVVERNGSRYRVAMTCDVEGSKQTIDGDYAMTGDTAYRGDMKMRFTPPLSGISEMNMKVDGRWLGPCRPGMKPGDLVMPGMPDINALNRGPRAGRLTPEEARRSAEEMLKNLGPPPTR